MNFCDHNHETNQEVRLLPQGLSDGNLIVCHYHYVKEIEFRRTQKIKYNIAWDLPAWESLEVYKAG